MCAPTFAKDTEETNEAEVYAEKSVVASAVKSQEQEGWKLLPVIQSLSKLCLYRQEEWWTDEVNLYVT